MVPKQDLLKCWYSWMFLAGAKPGVCLLTRVEHQQRPHYSRPLPQPRLTESKRFRLHSTRTCTWIALGVCYAVGS